MKQQIDKMVPFWVQTEKPAVEHMRQPGQGVPISGVCSSKSPFDAVSGQAGLHILIFGYVLIIVVVYKIVS
jgi:hypothetical protein